MIRYVTLLILAGILFVASAGAAPRHATACGTGALYLDQAIRTASFVAIGQTVAVGDNSNRFPPVANRLPASTFTPSDITGVGATLEPSRVFVGADDSPLFVDTERRIDAERQVRMEEKAAAKDITLPCGVAFGMIRYDLGATYLVVSESEGWPFGSVAWPVVDGQLLLTGFPRISVPATAVREYFQNLRGAARPDETGRILIDEGAMPLDDMVRYLESLVGEDAPTITPPETGTAGLR